MTIQQTISQLANQCVLCGLCIPHCPTYMIFRTENESPRGRISLFKALAEEQFKAPFDVGKELITSLDHCLACRACEKVCPSQVEYGTISTLGRELIATQYPQYHRSLRQKLTEKLLLTQSLHPLLKLSAKAAAPFQSFLESRSDKQSLFASIGSFSHEIALDCAQSSPLLEYYPSSEGALPADGSSPAEGSLSAEGSYQTKPQQQVILFKGCSSDLFEQQTLNDAVRLLNACRFDVVIPDKQQCCGAISARQGDTHQMKALAKQNIAQFQPLLQKSQAIISITNSCSGQLKEYNKLTDSLGLGDGLKDGLGDGLKDAAINGAAEFSDKVTDIIAFLAEAVKTAEIQFAPLAEAIGVHIPCSLQNVLKEEALLFDLLAHIPGVRLIKINDQYCCGAAGSYMLQYPEVANRLLDDKIEDVMQQHYSIIVSSNIGCSLHFKQGLKKHEQKIGRAVEVIHPVSLLARQLVISEEKA